MADPTTPAGDSPPSESKVADSGSQAPAPQPFAGVLLFGKWDSSQIQVTDPSLKDHVNVIPINIPNTGGRYVRKQFWKKKAHIVERLINKLMVTGHISVARKHIFTSGRNTGKKAKMSLFVLKAMDRIAERTKKNPIQIVVDAVQNAAPKGEVTTIEFGGVRRPVSVDTSPQRRVDMALSLLTKGAFKRSRHTNTSLDNCLAEELVLAANNDMKSFSVDKKENIERQALSSR